MTPTLSTARLILRPLTKATLRHVNWLTDPDVVRFSERRHELHTIRSCQRYIDSLTGRSHIWAITVADNGRHIGNITAATDEPNNVADIGIMIGDRECWGHHFGIEAWQASCDWLLDKAGGALRKLEGGCRADHIAMRRVFDLTGFTFEGEKRNHFLQGAQPLGAMFYGKF